MKEQSRELSTIDGRNVNGQARRYPNTPTLPADAVELENGGPPEQLKPLSYRTSTRVNAQSTPIK